MDRAIHRPPGGVEYGRPGVGGIDWSRSTSTINDLAVSVLGLAAACEGLADLVASAYVALLPDSIAPALIKRFPLPSADLVKLIRAAVERERPKGAESLPADYDRLAQVRADLAHSDLVQDRDATERGRLYNHRGRSLKVLPETITLDDLRAEVERATLVRAHLTALAYRLGYLRIKQVGGPPSEMPEYGPGPRPVQRDRDGNELASEVDYDAGSALTVADWSV